jgi:homoserine O-acetyltransferase
MHRILLLLALLAAAGPVRAQTTWPGQQAGDFVLHDAHFADGEVLGELRLHYVTLGTPHRGADGAIDNAVLLLHGTSGTGARWLAPETADALFGPGQPLDVARYYIVLPDGIGRGGSSKPSDGLQMGFPHYRYADMVAEQYALVHDHLGIAHLRLVLGASMGGMQSWMWAEAYPDFMDGVVPIASQPARMSGRNWLLRRLAIEAIRNDPDWQGGAYKTEPSHWIYTAPLGAIMADSPVALQGAAPDVAAGDRYYAGLVAQARKLDANDQLYATEAVEDYAPEAGLGRIRAKLLAINSADDQLNPAELGTLQAGVAQIPGAAAVVLPAEPGMRGHFTYVQASRWAGLLGRFMAALPGTTSSASRP